MNLETFFSNFELFADAPNGVQKLRELILQLAVQGKLVPQNPDDEPAAVLLEKIKEEKERLVKEGKIKKSKKLPPVDVGEMAFDLPQGWEWVRLGKIIESMTNGLYKPAKYYSNDGIGCIRMFNIQDGEIRLTKLKRIIVDDKELQQYTLMPGDFIVNRVNSRELVGKSAVIKDINEPLVFEAMNIRVRFIQKSNIPDYINLFFRTDRIRSLFQNDAKQASGQASISQPQVANILIPLPPLNEQHRIVTKVDALMKLCDELETRSQNKRDRILKLGEVATTKLLTPTTKETFNQHWKTISDNFDLLYSTPENVKQLRQAILQLAVMGKLVPQNPDDEPAAVLLEKIKEEKERLVKEGKIKKSKELPPVDVGEMAFELPQGWEWVKVGKIILSITGGGTPSKNNPQFWSGTIPWASVKDLKEKKYLEKTIDYITEEAIKKSSTNLIPKNRIIVCTRMGLGKIAINKIDLAINQDLKALQLPKEIDINYFYNSYLTLDIVGTGVTVSGIRQSELLNLAIPLPPLNEQHRIVTKVNQLMSLCDELEAKLTQSIGDRDKLMSAAVRQVLAV